jgi:hypothetical protein
MALKGSLLVAGKEEMKTGAGLNGMKTTAEMALVPISHREQCYIKFLKHGETYSSMEATKYNMPSSLHTRIIKPYNYYGIQHS